MKKYAKSLLSLILALMLVFALVGCGEDDVADDDDEDEDEEEVQEKESKEEDEDDEEVTEIEVAEEEEVEIEEGWVLFESDNGYTIAYPEKYEVTNVSNDMDFQISIETGSSINVTTANANGEKPEDLDREMLEEQLSAVFNTELVFDVFETIEINGMDVVHMAYEFANEYASMYIEQFACYNGDKVHTVSVGIMGGEEEGVEEDFVKCARTITPVE